MTECDAKEPEKEVCNALDDDCDGETDEDVTGGECFNVNQFGACPGVEVCQDGQLICQGPQPAAEECDGVDNDCDGQTDEEFPDTDGDNVPDCMEEDKDDDGVPDVDDNCPDKFNPGQEDFDGDLLGDVCDPDDDGDGFDDLIDCSPFDPNVYPGAKEVCDGKDNDCNYLVDEGFVDTDADGWKDCVDEDDDNDGFKDGEDCDPQDPEINPQAKEECDGKDNDCDGDIDEGFQDSDDDNMADCVDLDKDGDGIEDDQDNCPLVFNPSQEDLDSDGIGDSCDNDYDGDSIPNAVDNCPKVVNPVQSDVDLDGLGDACDPDLDGDGVDNDQDNCPVVPNPNQLDTDGDETGDACEDDKDGDGTPDILDCAPLNPLVNPEAEEVCDGMDNNCNSLVDEGFADTDADGWKDCVDEDDDGDGDPDDLDCAPLDPTVNSSALEVCDGFDNDCDGEVDEDLGELACGKGVCFHTVPACLNGVPQVCDPLKGVSEEVCDGLDNDCDGLVDEDLGVISCGLGVCFHTVPACQNGEPVECDPLEGASPEVCDGLDNDCDGKVDEELGTTTCGLGVCEHTVQNCVGGVPVECNPLEGASTEVCDGLDNDCDGKVDEELGTTTCGMGECEHTVQNCVNGVVQLCNPFEGASAEVCDGLDNDCDGLTDEEFDFDNDGVIACKGDCNDYDPNNWQSCDTCKDADGDGMYGGCDTYITLQGPDCDDNDPYNWVSCDSCVDADGDGYYVGCDSYSELVLPGPDCDDSDPNNWVSCTECIDVDGDGYYVNCDAYVTIGGPDCNDEDPAYHPNAPEGCDGNDYNCDGLMDNDKDLDGYPDAACGGTDCCDSDPEIKPDPAGGCALGKTCRDIMEKGLANGDGIYSVDPDGWGEGDPPFNVYCDMSHAGGGWTMVYKLS
ncbi:MAG: MopE-related protein, partial [Candidatus Thorarchaeota archaeon]